jgi:type II secretory pathway predicted ATPase ExeA
MLEYGLMNQAGFTVITGEIGSGKTTLIRKLLGQIENDMNISVGLVSNTHRSFGELLQWILLAFKLEYRGKEKVELYQTLSEFLMQEYSMGHRTILIIDEAQNLDIESLEQLRMLSNINADKDQVLQLMLVGQPGLRDMLRRPELEQFAQRIAVDFHLRPLDLQGTCDYIRHRLVVAGGDPNLFEAAACVTVYYYTRGVPRLINVLCDTALVCGYADQKARIDADLIHDVVRDRSIGGIFPVWGSDQDNHGTVLDIHAAKAGTQGTTE